MKNVNKNPVAEKAIQELEHEILRVVKSPGQLSTLLLHKATVSLNSRIRMDGLSAREILLQRDQFTNSQIPVNDRSIITAKHDRSLYNHKHSEKTKAGTSSIHPEPDVQVGNLVYVYSDRDKNVPRNSYLVTIIDGPWCHIKKFVGNTLRANSYKVKKYEVFKVPCETTQSSPSAPHFHDVDDEESNGTDSYEEPVAVSIDPVNVNPPGSIGESPPVTQHDSNAADLNEAANVVPIVNGNTEHPTTVASSEDSASGVGPATTTVIPCAETPQPSYRL